jgi:hypothetical protein
MRSLRDIKPTMDVIRKQQLTYKDEIPGTNQSYSERGNTNKLCVRRTLLVELLIGAFRAKRRDGQGEQVSTSMAGLFLEIVITMT